jgi:hypothetical protein
VAFWTVLTSGILLLRLAAAAAQRRRWGPLRSWLADAGAAAVSGTLAARLFTRRAAN